VPEPLRRPIEPPLSPRGKLRQAIAALNEEQARVNSNLWTAREQLTAARTDLDRVRQIDKASLAYAFVEGKPLDTADITAAEAAVEAAERAIGHWSDIEAACASELSGAERRISRRQPSLPRTMAMFNYPE
jgi:hypothetical protein